MNELNASHKATLALQTALSESTKMVTVKIATDDLVRMKAGNYKLCIAKKVGDSLDFVWDSSLAYMSTSVFSWTPQYKLFGTRSFSTHPQSTTNMESCGLGMNCTLNEYGILEPEASGGSATGLTLVNNYGPIHAGIRQLSTGLDGKTEYRYVYVSKNETPLGATAIITPEEVVRIWFQQDTGSEIMKTSVTSEAVELDLTDINELSCLYKDSEWSIV